MLGGVTDETQAHHRAGEDAAYEPDPRRWRILGVSLVIAFMALLDVTIVNVALPSIRAGLDTSNATVQWVVSGYALAFGLTLVAGGRLGDAYGRRTLMLVGLTGFVLSSAAVGLAPNAELVIIARLVQGASAGLLTPQNSGLVQQLFRGAERGRAFGMFGLTVGISSATGPVLGGLIIALAGEENGWRWLFLVNIPIGAVAMVAILRLVPKRRHDPADDRPRLDIVGAVLLGLGVLALLYPLVSVEAGLSPVVLVVLASPAFLVGFVRWERRVVRRGREPLLDVGLLRGLPGYASGLAVGAIYFTGFTGIFLVLSVHLQEAMGASPLTAGLLLTPFALGAAATAPLAGRLVSRIHRKLTVIALAIMMSGVLAAALLVPGTEGALMAWLLVPTLLVAGLGGGGVISPNFTLSLAEVPPRMGGAAGGAIQTGQRIGSSIGAALLMTVYHVSASAWSPATGLRTALLTAIVVLALAMAMAVRDLRLVERR
jgi:EmrB/QacA subfamily drug resistance transporter